MKYVYAYNHYGVSPWTSYSSKSKWDARNTQDDELPPIHKNYFQYKTQISNSPIKFNTKPPTEILKPKSTHTHPKT